MSAPSSDSAGIRQTIRALRNAGYTVVSVYDGVEDITDATTEQEIIDALMAVDDSYLNVEHSRNDVTGWVRFVMGNDPEEVICDYTLTLEDVLNPLTEGWYSE